MESVIHVFNISSHFGSKIRLTGGNGEGRARGFQCSDPSLVFGSVPLPTPPMLQMQTAGETFTTCLQHRRQPRDTLLVNYSVPHPSPPPPSFYLPRPLFFVLPLSSLTTVHLFLPLSFSDVCFTSLRFIKSRRDPRIRPAPTHVNQAHLLHSNRVSVETKLLPPSSFPSPYRVTCLLVKQTPPLDPLPCRGLPFHAWIWQASPLPQT